MRDKRKESVIFHNIYAGCYLFQVQHVGSRHLYNRLKNLVRDKRKESVIFLNIYAGCYLLQVQHEGSRRLYNRLKNLVRDKRKESVIFHNEFQVYAHCEREPGETLQQWQVRWEYDLCTQWRLSQTGRPHSLIIVFAVYLKKESMIFHNEFPLWEGTSGDFTPVANQVRIWPVCPGKIRAAWASAQSDQSLHCPPEEESVIFHNEYREYAHCDREPGETLQQLQIRWEY